FIHIVRDGRDVSRSCIGMGWAGNVWTGVERWIKAENLWSQMSKSLSDHQKVEVRYESLVSQPNAVLESICDFIGIAFEPGMLTYDQTTTYDLPNPKLIQQWKYKLSDREVQLVESRISNMLFERNYEISNLSIIKISFVMQIILRIQDWSKRKEFRIKRLGLPLFLADILSRRLGINSWQKNIKLKINFIQQSYLK
ncbi:MAG: sulfotransferase, partial [Cyanobacteria bacterium P01_A01_bin.40]